MMELFRVPQAAATPHYFVENSAKFSKKTNCFGHVAPAPLPRVNRGRVRGRQVGRPSTEAQAPGAGETGRSDPELAEGERPAGWSPTRSGMVGRRCPGKAGVCNPAPGRGSQEVRQGSAKPLYAGSIPAHASITTPWCWAIPLQASKV